MYIFPTFHENSLTVLTYPANKQINRQMAVIQQSFQKLQR